MNIAFIVNQLAALEPCYGQRGGNSARIYTRDGRSLEAEKRMLSVLKNIAGCYNADLKALRSNYSSYLSCGQNVPLVFTPALVLVPLKMRRPDYENDGATGYVNLDDVTGLTGAEEKSGGCRVHLVGGNSVLSLFSLKNTRHRLNTGRLARDRFCALQNSGLQENLLPGVIRELSEELYNESDPRRLCKELIRQIISTGSRK